MLQRLARHSSPNAYVFLTLTMVLWAGNHVIGKWANGQIPPMTLSFLRWTGAALIMLPVAWGSLRREWPEIRGSFPLILLLGLLGSGSYNTLQYLALTETTVTNSAILNSWAPVIIALAGAAIFKDRLRPWQMAGLFISLSGVLTIILRGDPAVIETLAFNRGDLVMLLGTVIWAAYTTLLRSRPAISTLSFAAATYSIAAIFNLPLAYYEHAHGQHIVSSAPVFAAILYTAVFASCLAYFLYAHSVEIIGATRSGVFIHLIPLFASAMAMLTLGERPHVYHAVGFTLILAGVWLASRAPASPPIDDGLG
jgi:drug/metabolite transporter (DMT)-like permease